jgi:hypothetical protein
MADDLITPGEDVQTGDATAAKPDKPIGISSWTTTPRQAAA